MSFNFTNTGGRQEKEKKKKAADGLGLLNPAPS
jgi:hypothetical protein